MSDPSRHALRAEMRLSPLALAAACAFASPLAHAGETLLAQAPVQQLGEVVVTASRIPTADFRAPYASEVHTREMIEQSGASTLYDYLARHSSLQVMPSYGDSFNQLLDMRGYGIESGNASLVVVVDGQRLNSIDGVPQFLSDVTLASIESIEISKGSGTVVFGDGAMAGVVQIRTRVRDGVTVRGEAGNGGVRNGSVTAGLSRENLKLHAVAEDRRQDGFSDPDGSGVADRARNRNQRARLSVRPAEPLWLHFEASQARVDTRYINAIPDAEFRRRPQSAVNGYSDQSFDVQRHRLSGQLAAAPGWEMQFGWGREDKTSNFVTWGSVYDYKGDSRELSLARTSGPVRMVLGYQGSQGERRQPASRTGKDAHAGFVQLQQHLDATVLSAGLRRERVRYDYTPASGTGLSDARDLLGWDVGANHQISANRSVFANLTRSYQAPHVDQFFDFGGSFNGFIAPARAHTLTGGVNQRLGAHRLKIAVFHARLKDEIYYDAASWTNTNIDKSHKYGLEVQDQWRVNERLSLNANYAFVRSVIDREDLGGGQYDGKTLPGVPRHSLALSAAWKTSAQGTLNVSSTYRSEAFAMSDFGNSRALKQNPWRRTDVSYRHRLGDWQVFAAVDNVFDQKNGIRASNAAGSIFPVSFTRQWRVGAQADF